MLGGGGPAAERRAFQARRSPTGQFVGRTRSTSIQRSRQASIGDSVPLERNVVLTGIDVLVMKGDWIGALYTFIDPTVSSSV